METVPFKSSTSYIFFVSFLFFYNFLSFFCFNGRLPLRQSFVLSASYRDQGFVTRPSKCAAPRFTFTATLHSAPRSRAQLTNSSSSSSNSNCTWLLFVVAEVCVPCYICIIIIQRRTATGRQAGRQTTCRQPRRRLLIVCLFVTVVPYSFLLHCPRIIIFQSLL